jgi:hypothetical protein
MTILFEHEQNQPTHDGELDELAAEAREKTGKNWQVKEYSYQKGFWRWKKTYYWYELLVEVGGCLPFQTLMCVNTVREAKCYLHGVLNSHKGL